MRVLNAAQMREADRRTIDEIGIPSIVLMENAGRQVAAALAEAFGPLDGASVAVLAGRGNNGGDGFVVARVLAGRGVEVAVYLIGPVADVRGDARVNLDVLGRLGLPVTVVATVPEWERHRADVLASDVIVDALFGTGLNAPLTGVPSQVVEDVNDSDVPVVAIDLPSGLSGDAHVPPGPHMRAALTVALGAPKPPLVLMPARRSVGDLVVADIGIPQDVIVSIGPPWVELIEPGDVRDMVPEREPETHKGQVGHVLIVAGSRGKTGAAHLAAVGALRSGAGLVTVATPASCVPVIAALGAEYMTVPLEEDDAGAIAAGALDTILSCAADVIAVGPGIGTGPGAAAVVRGLLAVSDRPIVIDADAINVLAGLDGPLSALSKPVVMTPHPGELARFAGLSTAEVQASRIGVATSVAARAHATVILKGHQTLIVSPEGRVGINPTGNPGMATGGSGDVLTGMLGAWLGQVVDADDACRLAVYLHGAAGDLAAEAQGEVAMTAGDIAGHLGAALRALAAGDGGGTDR
jgi:ADP-dependent NAD(P)H-hydrate dehydratase / NAD(P)H-hydrate epimerase